MKDLDNIETKWTAEEQYIIQEYVTLVRDAFKERLRKIILYGSRARGDADVESDYDFLLLFDKVVEQDRVRVRKLSWEISFEYNTVLVALPVKQSEFTEERYFYFYENVCKEGIEL